MNLVKCGRGHYYDEERYPSCPHCNAPALNDTSVTAPAGNATANEAATVAISFEGGGRGDATDSFQEDVRKAAESMEYIPEDQGEKTIGFFQSTMGTEPVVGWLVATAGKHFGEDFKLKDGRNFIGRAHGMDVQLSRDGTVSRERHAIIVYEPRGNVFIIQPGDSKELCYLNGDVVLGPKELKRHDRLVLGESELMFVPCCDEGFSWEKEKAKEKEAE